MAEINTTVVPFNSTSSLYENKSQNGSDVDLEEDLYEFVSVFVPLLWGILTVVGAFGNALVIYTLVRHGDKNATNYFVINLAISDFAFVVIVVPFTATLYALPEWIFGDGMCKITMYMIYVTLHATCLTLMAMTIDRYCAIVYAVQSRNWRTTQVSLIVCLIVWLVSFVVSLPFAIYFRTVTDDRGITYCMDQWPNPQEVYGKISIIVVVFTTYVVPLSVIIYSYAMILKTLWRNKMASGNHSNGITSKKAQQQEKRRKRVTKLVASVVIVFALFWLPIHILNMWFKLDPENFPKTPTMLMFKIASHTLSYANSCVNPFVYAFLSDGFRKAFRKTFPFIAQRYKICGGPADEYVSQVGLNERPTEQTKASMNIVNMEERKLMQTDL
ncbi:galanin receptor type 1-like isoform X2 [Ruditapes philippinarum]|uniref:galanin receptor type 1-like isoform X2 n=1 Tax=Ruditapes philippinarum TaxID=129788 RepID=UPI00295AD12F|nr:galanin receptor type 1-like isoform X2 [Ruditapes philippinarum]